MSRRVSPRVSRRVSIVVPVYNTGRYLAPCLDSLLAQDLPAGDVEILAVDDGSTDGSGALLDAYAARHARLRVIHQANSGWPGRPRNVGLAASTGTYVFFADADDYLAPYALRRATAFADEHGSDVVVPKATGVDGYVHSAVPWRRTEVDADLARAFHALGPTKLFRRSFLQAHGLRFPEGRVRLEDGIFVAEAYLLASRVSILADQDYYFARVRAEGGNISSRRPDPEDYLGSVARMIDVIHAHCRPPRHDADLADRLALLVYRRKGLKWFGPDYFCGMALPQRRAWLAAAQQLARSRVPAGLDGELPFPQRVRGRLVRAGDGGALLAFAAGQAGGAEPQVRLRDGRVLLDVPVRAGHRELDLRPDVEPHAAIVALHWAGACLQLRLRACLRGLRATVGDHEDPGLELLLRERAGGEQRAVPLRHLAGGEPGELLLAGLIAPAGLGRPRPGRWDISLRLRPMAYDDRPPREFRLGARGGAGPLDREPAAAAGGRGWQRSFGGWRAWPYLTTYGNLTLAVEPE